MLEFVMLVLVIVGLGLAARAAHRAARADGAHQLRDYVSAAFFATFPLVPSAASITGRLIRWAVAEELPISAVRKIAPAGIVFGLTHPEFERLGPRRPGVAQAIADEIVDVAEARGRTLLNGQPWIHIVVDSEARPGLPTMTPDYDASSRPGSRVREIQQSAPEMDPGSFGRSRQTGDTDIPADYVPTDYYPDRAPKATRVAADGDTEVVRHVLRTDAKTFAVTRDITLGRGASADVLVTDRRVSREHAVIRLIGAVCVIEDAGSFNGTYVDGIRITEPTDLDSGSIIQLGPDGPKIEYSSITSR